MTSTATVFEPGRYAVRLDLTYLPDRVQHLVNPRWETDPDSGCRILVGIVPRTGGRTKSFYVDLVRSVERMTPVFDHRATGTRTGWVVR